MMLGTARPPLIGAAGWYEGACFLLIRAHSDQEGGVYLVPDGIGRIDDRDGIRIADADMGWAEANKFAIFLMELHQPC